MKNECSIVRDLLPLYVENMVSAETAEYIDGHLRGCAECRAELDSMRADAKPSESESKPSVNVDSTKPFKKILKRINKRFYMLAYSLIVFFIFLGFGWTGGEDLMYNSLIMPIVGVFGYCIFRWHALYKVPILLLLIDIFACVIGMVEIDLYSAVIWTLVYSGFVWVGIAIAFLLHFALGKEKDQ